jgi:TRAP-type C4-dicarboxylate transport system permease small subunit
VEWIAAARSCFGSSGLSPGIQSVCIEDPLAWSEELAMLLFQWVSFWERPLGSTMRHFGIN